MKKALLKALKVFGLILLFALLPQVGALAIIYCIIKSCVQRHKNRKNGIKTDIKTFILTILFMVIIIGGIVLTPYIAPFIVAFIIVCYYIRYEDRKQKKIYNLNKKYWENREKEKVNGEHYNY